mgnify:CR=1 FL=1|jgi:hypothetical protein
MNALSFTHVRRRISSVLGLRWWARVTGVVACLALCSCSSLPWAPQTQSPTPTPLPDEYLCDIVPADVLNDSLNFRTGHMIYSHYGGNEDYSDGWECTLMSPDIKQMIEIKYTINNHWNTPTGWVWSPLTESAPEDEKRNADPITLMDHEGQGWIIGRSPDVNDRPVLAWQYLSGYYLVISMSYKPEAPVLDSNLQALQNLALAVIDEIPPIAAEPDLVVTTYPNDDPTDNSIHDN